VVDLAFETSRTVMSSRAVSADPRHATIYAREFLAGLKSCSVLGALKHFPGLGAANLDTHHELPSVDRSWKKLWNEDLAPYRALRRQAPMVLVSHAAYPAVTRDRTPASLSRKWMTEILRKKIGYRGLIVSDDLEMGGVLKAAPIDQAAVEHICAGGDLAMICHVEDHVRRAYEAIIQTAERDSRFARRCEESIARVLAFKKKSKELTRRTQAPGDDRIQTLSRRLWEFSEQIRLEAIKRDASRWQAEA
jgi:beta-N-acetylhexosaminidase